MIERRFHDRRSGVGGGRRATDQPGSRGSHQAPHARSRAGASTQSQGDTVRLVIVGCRGVAGANMARFLKLWAGDRLDVTLVEPESMDRHAAVATAGKRNGGGGFAEYFPYDRRELSGRYGVRIVGAPIRRVDPVRHLVLVADGSTLPYDRIEFAAGTTRGARLRQPS